MRKMQCAPVPFCVSWTSPLMQTCWSSYRWTCRCFCLDFWLYFYHYHLYIWAQSMFTFCFVLFIACVNKPVACQCKYIIKHADQASSDSGILVLVWSSCGSFRIKGDKGCSGNSHTSLSNELWAVDIIIVNIKDPDRENWALLSYQCVCSWKLEPHFLYTSLLLATYGWENAVNEVADLVSGGLVCALQ